MGKITPGVTPEDEFRRVINEAGGNVQINTTPANLLKALKDIGGNVSYDSGDTAIVPAVNEGGIYPHRDGTVESYLGYGRMAVKEAPIELYDWCYSFGIKIFPTLDVSLGYIRGYSMAKDRIELINKTNFCKCLYGVSITVDGVKIPTEDIILYQGVIILFAKNPKTESILSDYKSLIGKRVKIHVESGTFTYWVGTGEPEIYNDNFDIEFNFGDTYIVNHVDFPNDTFTIANSIQMSFDRYANWSDQESYKLVYGNDDYSVSPYYKETFNLFSSLSEEPPIEGVMLSKPVSFYTKDRGWVSLPAKVYKVENKENYYMIRSTEIDPNFEVEPAYYQFVFEDMILDYSGGKLQGIRMVKYNDKLGMYTVSYHSNHVKAGE